MSQNNKNEMSSFDKLLIQKDMLLKTLSILNKKNLINSAIYCENLMLELLNSVYGLSLVNCNLFEHNNESFDLEDKTNQICIQVTTTTANLKGKAKNTLDKYKRINNHSRLILFIVGDVNKAYSIDGIEIWDMKKLMEDIEIQPERKHLECLLIMNKWVEDGLLFYIENQDFDNDMNKDKIYLDSSPMHYFVHGLGNVRMDAFIPTTITEKLSCLMLFRMHDAQRCQLTMGEDEVIHKLFYNISYGMSENRRFIAYIYNGLVTLQLGNARLCDVYPETAIQLCSLIEELYEIFNISNEKILQTVGGKNFVKKDDKFCLVRMPVWVWKQMFAFANCHDMDEGNSEWHLFLQQNAYGSCTGIMIGGDVPNRGIKCHLKCELINFDTVIVYWKSGYYYNMDDNEGFDNISKWKVDFTYQWITEKWIPYIIYLEIGRRFKMQSFLYRMVNPMPAFNQFMETFDLQDYFIYPVTSTDI